MTKSDLMKKKICTLMAHGRERTATDIAKSLNSTVPKMKFPIRSLTRMGLLTRTEYLRMSIWKANK